MIRIGNAHAFWGDRPSAAYDLLVQEPTLDFLTMDYLAEVSMSILAQQRQRQADFGYPRDFVEVVRSLADYWAAGGRCKLIANAGGLNPIACGRACQAALESAGCRSLKIAVVSGDDCVHLLASSKESNSSFFNLDTHQPIESIRERLVTANAYLGSRGIVAALAEGAELVITGRVADPSLVVAPCIYAFGWAADDWHRLAGATIAGHLLECGTHVTGGIATDWLDVEDPAHMGFPIAEIESDGSCTITKSPLTGGQVSEQTVKEQLVYEIGDPAKYLSPDVTVSFLKLNVQSTGRDRVHVSGGVGTPPPSTLKVSATYRDGYRATGMLTIVGEDCVLKARRCAAIVMQRLKEAGHTFRDTIVECLGNAESVPMPDIAPGANELFETVLRMAVESESSHAVEQFSREFVPLVTAGPQGTTGYAEGRPRVHQVFRYWPCLIEADRAAYKLDFQQTADTRSQRERPAQWPPDSKTAKKPLALKAFEAIKPPHGSTETGPKRLSAVAYGRSGDKGTAANVGILVRSPEQYPWLLQWLTANRVANYFAPLGTISVERFELPNLGGVNFIIRDGLKRGLRNDAQGKALAQALLTMQIE